MTLDTQAIPPKMLGDWTRILRMTSKLSQDALAEASGLTARTIQRVESGERASLTTRRCLARGLGYDDPDIFDDPAFVGTVTGFFESLQASQIKAEEALHPDHIKLEVTPTANGAGIAGLIGCCNAWVFHCDESASPEAQAEAAALFDNLQDYGDIWSELSHGDRLEAQRSFGAMLDGLASMGLRAYQAMRPTRMVGANWTNNTPISFTIGYVTIVPAEQELSHILVPKRS